MSLNFYLHEEILKRYGSVPEGYARDLFGNAYHVESYLKSRYRKYLYEKIKETYSDVLSSIVLDNQERAKVLKQLAKLNFKIEKASARI